MARDDLRCFIAVELPPSLRRRLNQEIGFLQLAGADVKWTFVDNLHLTVRFIGDVRPDEVIEIQRVVKEACANIRKTRITVGGMSTLPVGKDRPRVVVAGVRGDLDPLKDLFNELQGRLAEVGFRPERKGYRPHVTVGRVRGSRGIEDLMHKVEQSNRNDFGEFNIDRVHLMMSDLTQDGPVYTPMQTFRLGG